MTPADAVLWMVGAFTLRDLLINLRSYGFAQRGWLLVQAFVLGLTLMAAWLGRDDLAYAAGACWVVFMLAPGFAAQRQYQLGIQYRFAEAARWGRLAGLLHPFDGFRAQATYLFAQGALLAGDLEAGRRALEKLRGSPSYRELAQVELWRIDRRWSSIIAFIESGASKGRPRSLAGPYLRALGESGEVSRLLAAYAALPVPLRRQPMHRLLTLAFAGQVALVERLLAGRLASMNPNGQDYWRGVARQACGEREAAATYFNALIERGALVAQSRQRLEEPLAAVDEASLTPGARQVLAETAREFEEARAMAPATHAAQLPIATLGIASVLVALFAVRFFPGWDGIEGLTRLGALVLPPDFTSDGVLWRVVCAGLLHFNATHVFMNVVGLWVLGRDLERSWGAIALVGCVVGSSVGAYATALFFMPVSPKEPTTLVGASAGVMGLVGALATFSAVGYYRHRNRMHGVRLRMAVLIVLLQLVIDHFTPMVSSFLHIAGTGWGAVLAVPFSLRYFARRERVSVA